MQVKWLEFMQHVDNVQGAVYSPLGAMKTKECKNVKTYQNNVFFIYLPF